MIDAFIKVVQQVGFPIAVATILLLRYDKRLDEQTKVLHKIAMSLQALKKMVNGEEEE